MRLLHCCDRTEPPKLHTSSHHCKSAKILWTQGDKYNLPARICKISIYFRILCYQKERSGGGEWKKMLSIFRGRCIQHSKGLLTLKVLDTTIDAQWEGMGDVGSVRYKPALLTHARA